MGVPKFFRWMSERYPAISQLIAENRIPEFDCLYLDMNGIIHNCTHSDSDSATFRMTEEKMFTQIFNYIEHLFGKIRPRKVFFMAIDGVAPRAKMNQQRARRFRTALDAEKAKDKAIKAGVELPLADAFDSNCITPGTEFMAKLTRQLKYFINRKISEDVEWQVCEVILSGHEVPGEGEHKIMEYIRMAKAQPGYDPNVRHCLYGLDADLIMLGLLSHDPHFCLLREEVSFGRNQKKSKELEHQKFYLMHLCIVREYLELEFQELKLPGVLSSPFDIEQVIDDFILMAFFVGNDFLPNLPNLHINEGALALMFKVYKSILPKIGGFINENGYINVERLGVLLDELSQVEYRFFEAENADASWFKGKQMNKTDVMEPRKKLNKRGVPTISSAQGGLLASVKLWLLAGLEDVDSRAAPLDLPTSLKAADRVFIQDLADEMHLKCEICTSQVDDRHLRLRFPPRMEGDSESEINEDNEGSRAILRVVKKYDDAQIVDTTPAELEAQQSEKYEAKFQAWKNKYYVGKFGWGLDNEEEIRKLTENYVQGLQWVLFYYYRGVASWPWYYAYHYSPMISDVRSGLGASMDFVLGQPFRPYQQLMGVLPDRSKNIVPSAFHDLMTNPDSPIIDFYPRDFELDMNGKKMEWEAIVKIPFIDEKRLLPAMRTRENLLSRDEKDRNEFGVSLKFSFSSGTNYLYQSSLVGIFPDIPNCHCVENIFDLPIMEGLDFHAGLPNGAKLGRSALYGFPSLETLPFFGSLGFHGVSVFQQESRNESMVITLSGTEQRTKTKNAVKLLGRRIHVGYPFLSEARVVRVSDELNTYSVSSDGGEHYAKSDHTPAEIEAWHRKAQHIEATYSKRLGMVIGGTDSLLYVDSLKGLKKLDSGATIKEYGEIAGVETVYATQMIVEEVLNEDLRFLERAARPVDAEFPIGSRAFFLGEFNYGRPLEVVGHQNGKIDVWVSTAAAKSPEFGRQLVSAAEKNTLYLPTYTVAKRLGLNPLVLSKLTASFQVLMDDTRVNLGLNLKFEAKKQKVLGYSRRGSSGWELSEKAVDLIREYIIKFPQFIAGIQRNPQGSIFKGTDFYGESEVQDKIKEIQQWLKLMEAKNFERVPLDAEQLDSATVHQIEGAADNAFKNDPPGKGDNKKIKGVPRNALLKPSDAEQRLSHQHFSLGDRVVYIQDSGRVPIATRGTIVGKTQTSRTTLLDVLFDVTFMSGTSLEDRCSPFRGSTVPSHTVLNLTNKQIIATTKAGIQNRHTEQSESNTGGAIHVSTNPNTYGQLTSAPMPEPLHDSFRRALTGRGSRAIPYVGSRPEQKGERSLTEQKSAQSVSRNNTLSGTQNARAKSHGQSVTGKAISSGGRGGRTDGYNERAAIKPVVDDRAGPSIGTADSPYSRPYHGVPPPSSLRASARGRGQRGRSTRGLGHRGRGIRADDIGILAKE